VRLLAFLAKIMGVQFKIDGFPYGAAKKIDHSQKPDLRNGSAKTHLAKSSWPHE
jgi:hypothetical protein